MLAGIILGIFAAATFGLIPLFTLPLLAKNITAESILCYRFIIASLIMLPILIIKKEKILISFKDHIKIALVSLMYMLAALFYFHAFRFLPSGMVTTLQYLYPVMVMVVMIVFYHEPFSWKTALALILAFIGVALLANGGDADNTKELSGLGIFLSLLCGVFLALYYLGIRIAKMYHLTGIVITFYVMFWGMIICLVNAFVTNTFVPIIDFEGFALAFLLALVTAVISNYMVILAIQKIGPTLTSIVGAAEPLTAVIVGILVFNENFTFILAIGGILIISSVIIPLIGKN